MRIYRKEADEVQLIAFPDEHVQKGDYFVIEDPAQSRGLLVQAIDLQYANVPGVLEDILRDVMTDGELSGEDVDPLNISSQVDALKDTRLAICKIRGTIAQDGTLSPSTSWLPSRTSSKIRPYAVNRLIMNGGKMPVKLGHNDGEPISVDASGLDGGLNIITGRKGSGKSHLAKLLLLSMAGWGAPCIVLDVNGEYINLHKSKDGRQSSARLTVLAPRSGLNFSMSKLGLRTVAGVLSHALDLPATSSKVFTTIWKDLEARGDLTLPTVIQAVQSWSCHDSVREALTSRLQVLMESGLVDEAIYRQADNVFIFNFTNEHDIEAIGKVAKADSDTIRYLVRGIPTRRCLLLGNVVKDLPLMVDVEQLDVRTMGETRLFFS